MSSMRGIWYGVIFINLFTPRKSKQQQRICMELSGVFFRITTNGEFHGDLDSVITPAAFSLSICCATNGRKHILPLVYPTIRNSSTST